MSPNNLDANLASVTLNLKAFSMVCMFGLTDPNPCLCSVAAENEFGSVDPTLLTLTSVLHEFGFDEPRLVDVFRGVKFGLTNPNSSSVPIEYKRGFGSVDPKLSSNHGEGRHKFWSVLPNLLTPICVSVDFV